MFRWRKRTNRRKDQGTTESGAWAAVRLNCPICGRRLASVIERNSHIFACTDHGAWFVASADGRLYDASNAKR